ncbi:hypothetical protein Tco_1237892 [Tanacetum coccineum]
MRRTKLIDSVGGLPDNIQGNVIAAEPTKLQDAIRVANNLMYQKLKGYARSAENKRRLDNNPRDNRGQQPVFKRQIVGGQNVARVYHLSGNNEKKVYVGSLPYCNKYKFHHAGPCTVRPGHFRKDCPKLRNQNRRNKTGNKNGNKTGNQAGSNEATTKAYAIRGGGGNPDSNVVTVVALLDVAKPSTLDTVKLDKWIEDVPIVREFPEVFPEDFPGLPLARQVEFQIDLVPGAAPVARAPKEHEWRLKLIMRLLKKEELYAKFSKCEFWLSKVQFLGHVIDREGIHVDPAKIESIKDWASPKTPTEIRQFLEKAEAAFQLLKQKLCSALILALPEGSENFVVHEKNYTTHDLEHSAVVFAEMWRHCHEMVYRSASCSPDHEEILHTYSCLNLLADFECSIEDKKEENFIKDLHGIINKLYTTVLTEPFQSIPFHPGSDKMYQDLNEAEIGGPHMEKYKLPPIGIQSSV